MKNILGNKKESGRGVQELCLGKVQSQYRLVLGREAIEALEEAVGFVNRGFSAGEVSKNDLATYVFKSLKRFLSKSELTKIRDEYFDDRKALDNLVRSVEKTGSLPADFKKLLKDRGKAPSAGTKSIVQDEST